jgi:hypothetical protein
VNRTDPPARRSQQPLAVTRVGEDDWRAWRAIRLAALADAPDASWARSEGAVRLGLWVPADNARAQACYERQGFRATGRSRPFPGSPGRSISEMYLELGAGPAATV